MNLPLLAPPIYSNSLTSLTPVSEIKPQDVQKCWSAAKCTGKVLSNRDFHNCCNKGSGTSWSDRFGNCKRC